MFTINDDMSIYVTRGDTAFFRLTATNEDGEVYKFQAGDVVRIKVFDKKACENVAFQKDFGVEEATEYIEILLTENETKIGEVISKPTDYWYELELNPYTNPQTIVGYDDDGPKVFKLFPEGANVPNTPIKPEDIPVVDNELDQTSDRPVQNQAIARAVVALQYSQDTIIKGMQENHEQTEKTLADFQQEIADNSRETKRAYDVLNARINTFTTLQAGSTTGDAELTDGRVDYKGNTHTNIGEHIREVSSQLSSEIEELLDVQEIITKLKYVENKKGFYSNGVFYDNTGFDAYKYECNPNSKYYITAYYLADTSNISICHYFKSDGTYIGLEPNMIRGNVYTDYEITTPNECGYFIVVNKITIDYVYINGYGVAKSITHDSRRIYDLERNINGVSVSMNNDVISITRAYSNSHDLKITMEKCGSSSLMQLKGFYFNAIDGVSNDFSKVSVSDWVAPYMVRAINNPTSKHGELWYYTGGYHGANNGANGYPTAITDSFSVFCDGKAIQNGERASGKHVIVKVINKICGNNTTDTTGGNDFRYILKEEVTYDFDGETCNVTVIIEALEDVSLIEYYGLQIASSGGLWQKAQSIFGDKIIDIELNNTNVTQNFDFIPDYMCATDGNGNYAITHVEKVGLGRGSNNDGNTRRSHISNGKMYYDLVYNTTPLQLVSGERVFTKGWYKWSPNEYI